MKKAFTYVEFLIVLVMVALFSAILFPAITRIRKINNIESQGYSEIQAIEIYNVMQNSDTKLSVKDAYKIVQKKYKFDKNEPESKPIETQSINSLLPNGALSIDSLGKNWYSFIYQGQKFLVYIEDSGSEKTIKFIHGMN